MLYCRLSPVYCRPSICSPSPTAAPSPDPLPPLPVASFENGKQLHLAAAAEHLAIESTVKVSRVNTLFIDDDMNNIRVALNADIAGVWFDPQDAGR